MRILSDAGILLFGLFFREILRYTIIQPIAKLLEKHISRFQRNHPLHFQPFFHALHHRGKLKDCMQGLCRVLWSSAVARYAFSPALILFVPKNVYTPVEFYPTKKGWILKISAPQCKLRYELKCLRGRFHFCSIGFDPINYLVNCLSGYHDPRIGG